MDMKELMKNKELVSSWMEDEESRFIFEKVCEYNDTQSFEPIRDIVINYAPKVNDYQENEYRYIDEIRKSSKENIWIWGSGMFGKRVLKALTDNNIQVNGIIDIDKSKAGSVLGKQITIYPPEDVDFKNIDCLIISMFKNISDAVDLAVKKGMNEKNIIVFNDYIPTKNDKNQYFDEIVMLNNGEVFVDVGAFDLETSLCFSDKCIQNNITDYKIIAFEPSKESYKKCLEITKKNSDINISLVNAGLYCENTVLGFDETKSSASCIDKNNDNLIRFLTLDEYTDDKITFIKMDIEGAELNALKGCKNTIINNKPKLAICVYHKAEDIIEIPMYIKELVPEYKLYLRHYSNCHAETVLYALPY